MAADPASPTGKADPRRAFAATSQVSSAERMFPHSAARISLTGISGPDISGLYVVRYDAPIDPFALAAEVSRTPGVEYAEPWFIYEISDATAYTPTDSSFNLQWYLKTVRADSAWDIEKGDSNVVIGFVDTGVQTDHPDLAANLRINPGEDGANRTNGVDDDGNGYIDDWGGWDFGGADYVSPVADNDPRPTSSSHGHGTHTAGLGCAVTDNNLGIAGTGFRTRYLPVKASSDNDHRGAGSAPFIIAGYQGIVYAAEQGADIISLSWGGSGYAQAEQDIINYVTSLGALVVAAAGNTGSSAELQYPASYDNVISVAGTQISADLKATYSSYNERVDVCTPGGQGAAASQIYSTYYPNTYAYSSGTSMSTPIAAGVAALVKAHFPTYTPQQVGEQMRVTCDDIYTSNSTYRYQLGKGRVNAYRALTQTLPSIRMLSFTATDDAGGNGNGAFEVNETVAVAMDFTNFLSPTTGATTITLTSTDANVVVLNSLFLPGALATGGTAGNQGNPFLLRVQPGIGSLKTVLFTLDIADAGYSDRQQFTILFNPTFANHTINDVHTTLTNNGRIGFQNFPTNSQGIGFIFGGANQLFEGGLLLGTSATKLLNVVRNAGGTQDNDFGSTKTYSLLRPGPLADEQGYTYFADSIAAPAAKLNVRVTMESYAYQDAPDDRYVIASYGIKNVSGAPITALYAGIFLDWDVHGPSTLVNPDSYFDSNRTSFDAGRAMGYAWYDTAGATPYCGVVALDGAASFRGLRNSATIDLSDAAKWAWLSGGILPDTGKGDVHTAISSGPFTFANNVTQKVAFALVAGNSLAELQASADAAIARWNAIETLTDVAGDGPTGLPGAFALEQNYPNPFNPSTTIRYALPSAGPVRLTIYSILGERVRTLVDAEAREAGYHEAVWNGTDDGGRSVASGVYIYRMDYTDADRRAFSRSMKFVLVR
jgi:subtilisin family serine protease